VLVSVSVFATVYFLRKPVSSIAIKSEERAGGTTEHAAATLNTEQPASASRSSSPSLILPSLQDSTGKPAVTASAPAPASTIALLALAPKENNPAPGVKSSARAEPPIMPAAEKPASAKPSPATPAIAAASSQPIPAPEAPDPTKPNPKAQTFVDTIKVTGIRAFGDESKVLMNDRVYRLNDIVDRSLGLRLIEVSNERLVFVDENGIRYTRYF
jgi:hypothetical protein